MTILAPLRGAGAFLLPTGGIASAVAKAMADKSNAGPRIEGDSSSFHVAADVSPLHLSDEGFGADSRRLLRSKGQLRNPLIINGHRSRSKLIKPNQTSLRKSLKINRNHAQSNLIRPNQTRLRCATTRQASQPHNPLILSRRQGASRWVKVSAAPNSQSPIADSQGLKNPQSAINPKSETRNPKSEQLFPAAWAAGVN